MAACLLLPQASQAQKPNQSTGLQVTSSTDASQLVNAILGSGVTEVGTPTLVGQSDANGAQQGLFSTTGPNILGTGFDQGILLTSGYASNVVGPNESSFQSQAWNSAGDTDLDTLTGGTTHDANSLIFNFTVDPNVSQLGFNYVFGSEEYNEFVGSPFNDGFGFYVDGNNVAVLPGSGDTVSINNVNSGKNSTFYRDNSLSDFPNGAPINTELDGLTTVLYADVFHSLDPNKSVHQIKLVIADTGDTGYDSAVFIQGSSFGSTTPPSVPEAGTSVSLGIGLVVLAGLTVAARRRAKVQKA